MGGRLNSRKLGAVRIGDRLCCVNRRSLGAVPRAFVRVPANARLNREAVLVIPSRFLIATRILESTTAIVMLYNLETGG